ncbi:MAG: hypothetical protein GY720_20365 [bacterium]|nr:hypothetical protein [bacterium]
MPFVDPIEPDPPAAILWLAVAPIVAAVSVASMTWGLAGRPPSLRRILIGSGTIIAIPIGLGVVIALTSQLGS